MSPNIELLERTLAHIEAHPEEWNQGAWRCESGLCFAGTTAALCGGEWVYPAEHWQAALLKANEHPEEAAWVRAQRLLRIDDDQAAELFDAANDLDDLHRIVADIKSSAPGETPPSLGADPNSVVVSPPAPLATTEPSAAGGVPPAPPAAGSGLHPRADHRPSEGQDR